VTPDVIVKKIRGKWTATLNRAVIPRVKLNQTYASLFQEHRESRHSELAAHLQEARWTVRNVQQRFSTILLVAEAILKRQQHFLEFGPMAMKPLGLREIAEELGLHESTVSRVTNNKYMATPAGVFELKYFFSREMTTASGGACSATAIRGVIKEMIEAENPTEPLSDAQIARLLVRQGLKVARRTVTKYRQLLKLAPSSAGARWPFRCRFPRFLGLGERVSDRCRRRPPTLSCTARADRGDLRAGPDLDGGSGSASRVVQPGLGVVHRADARRTARRALARAGAFRGCRALPRHPRGELRGAPAYMLDYRLRRHDGQYRWILDSGVPRFEADGAWAGYVGSGLDIDERKKAEEQLAERVRTLRVADHRQAAFLSMLSHELRNPLAPIANAASVLRSLEKTNPVLVRLREILERQVDRLERLVENLVDATRSAQGQISLVSESIAIDSVVRGAAESSAATVGQFGHSLDVRLPTGESIWVRGDLSRLTQALSNVITNAAKFTHEAGIIWLRVQALDDRVEISVTDRGQGMTPDFLPHAFELFARRNRAPARGHAGSASA
jgi:signal transduction histidine kinase